MTSSFQEKVIQVIRAQKKLDRAREQEEAEAKKAADEAKQKAAQERLAAKTHTAPDPEPEVTPAHGQIYPAIKKTKKKAKKVQSKKRGK